MKNKVLAVVLAAFICFSAGKPKKEFEGIIVYTTLVESKHPDFTSDTLQSAYGPVMTLYYKNGNYKMVYSGNDIKEIYYLKATNTQYMVRKGIDTLFTARCDIEIRTLISSTYNADAGKIVKRKCSQVINDMGDIKNYYWFDPSIYVNPDQFKQHVFGHFNVFVEKAQSFWIKYKFEAPLLNVTHTAVKITRQEIPDSIFRLPNFPEINNN